MPDYQKVLAYVVRLDKSGDLELLVFTHSDQPEAGLQVPAGTVDDGETPELAVVRELEEESGLRDIPLVGLIDRYSWTHPTTGNRHHRNVFHFEAGADLPAKWEHRATGSAEEEGLTFCFEWMPIGKATRLLTASQGQSLSRLTKVTR